jgi:pSer/pThr/pTyr-binding forkhead associated (FHA) protein
VASPDADDAPSAPTAPTPVRLSYQGTEILLVPGRYLIGRSAACHVVLDDPLVSRRHACIEVTDQGATVDDLGSINGVFVNGQRVGDGAQKLSDGDRLDIGNAQLAFRTSGAGYERHASGTHGLNLDTLSGADPVVPADEPVSTSAPEVSTRQVNGILMLSVIAERSLEKGRIREAEEMLRSHLASVMDDARARRDVEPATIESALGAALSLATATRKGRWFDYCIELLSLGGQAYTDALLARLERAAASVEALDVAELRRLALGVRGRSPGFDQLRAAQRLDSIARSAAERKR